LSSPPGSGGLEKALCLTRDRGFESGSLQRRESAANLNRVAVQILSVDEYGATPNLDLPHMLQAVFVPIAGGSAAETALSDSVIQDLMSAPSKPVGKRPRACAARRRRCFIGGQLDTMLRSSSSPRELTRAQLAMGSDHRSVCQNNCAAATKLHPFDRLAGEDSAPAPAIGVRPR
jgi:hypothetical protein